MGGFSSFVVSFCTSLILLGFLYMLCPEGTMSASVKYIFCLCFVCCVLGGALTVPRVDWSGFEIAEQDTLIKEQNANNMAVTVFEQALSDSGINFKKIAVDTNKLQDGSIVIIKVTVFTDVSKDTVLSLIGSNSYEVEVINE